MKKIFTLAFSCLLAFSLIGCNASQPPQENDTSNTNNEETNSKSDKKVLIVYFSMPETADSNNMTQEEDNSVVVIDGEVLGNTQYVAQVIQESTEGKLFRIEPSAAYPTDHSTLVDLAKDEQNKNSRPKIKDRVKDFDQYDTIFVGYPNWWADMPMIMYSFFDEYDCTGKEVIPFNTHGGSGFSDTIQTITDLEPDATVIQKGFTTSRDDVENSKNDIIEWLNELGF